MATALPAPWETQAENLRDRPFTLEHGAGGIVAHRTWREARDGILSGLAEGRSVIALLGDPGAGKTLLLHEIERELAQRGRVVRLLDDADRLPPSALVGLGRRADTVCLLAGQRGFRARARLWDDVGRIVWLRPMPTDEVARFVASRLQAAGRPRGLFEAEAVLELARRSDGLPRRVLILSGDALQQSEAAGDARVTAVQVRAAADRRILRHPPFRAVNTAEPVVLPTPAISAANANLRRSHRPGGLLQAAGYALAFTAGGAAFVAMMLGLS
jgi:type II secretory pathway predicted ATPase ExeA